MRRAVSFLMSIPVLYNTVQWVLAGPLTRVIKQRLKAEGLLDKPTRSVLDVGCGPGIYAGWFHDNYVGIDLEQEYIAEAKRQFAQSSKRFEVMDATKLSFPAASFDSGVSIGLYHHLDDASTQKSLAALRKIVRENGKIYVIDAIFPPRPWRNPVGYVLRRMDRGKHVRTYDAYAALLRAFDVKTMSHGRAGFLDYIYYEL